MFAKIIIADIAVKDLIPITYIPLFSIEPKAVHQCWIREESNISVCSYIYTFWWLRHFSASYL